MYKITILASLLLVTLGLSGQSLDAQIEALENQINDLERQQEALAEQVETVKLSRIHRDLEAVGLPSENYIKHSALFLEYAEAYEQAKWVAHILTPDVITGTAYRSNDFREDPLVTTGTAVEKDYFLKHQRGTENLSMMDLVLIVDTWHLLLIFVGQKRRCLKVIFIPICLRNGQDLTERVGRNWKAPCGAMCRIIRRVNFTLSPDLS